MGRDAGGPAGLRHDGAFQGGSYAEKAHQAEAWHERGTTSQSAPSRGNAGQEGPGNRARQHTTHSVLHAGSDEAQLRAPGLFQ